MPENQINYDFIEKSMSVEISVLVVNLNNLLYTKQCIEDLLNQDVEFNLRLVDQNSSEEGTNDFFNNFFYNTIMVNLMVK
jgi:GT2 family glycosyltransferase